MILRNSLRIERNVVVLFKVLKSDTEYIVYEDYNTKNVYAGKRKDNHLYSLNEKEFKFVNNIYLKLVENE